MQVVFYHSQNFVLQSFLAVRAKMHSDRIDCVANSFAEKSVARLIMNRARGSDGLILLSYKQTSSMILLMGATHERVVILHPLHSGEIKWTNRNSFENISYKFSLTVIQWGRDVRNQ